MSEATIYLDGRPKAREDVLQQALRAATGFEKMGIREGDTVALLLRNDFSFFEVQQAAAAIGAYSVPLNWHGKAEELLYVLNDSKPKTLVAHADLLEPMREQIPAGIKVFVVPTPPEVQARYSIKDELTQLREGDASWEEWCT